MAFERRTKVRLTKDHDGLTAGTEGRLVMGVPPTHFWVQFGEHAHEVPVSSLERVYGQGEPEMVRDLLRPLRVSRPVQVAGDSVARDL